MSKRLLRVAVVAFALGGVLAEHALAQVVGLPDDLEEPGSPASPSSGDTADSLFLRAKSAMAKKDYAAACVDFERSLALQRRVTALVNLANCRELNGELATAWRLFGDTIAALEKTSGAEAEALRNLARQRAESLRPRLSGIIVKVPEGAPEGLQVLVNGAALRPEEFGQMLPKDGGTIYIRAVAPDVPPWSTTVDLEDSGDVETVEVSFLGSDESIEAPKAKERRGRARSRDTQERPQTLGRKLRWRASGEVGALVLFGRVYVPYQSSDDRVSVHAYSFGESSRSPAVGVTAKVSLSLDAMEAGIFGVVLDGGYIDDGDVEVRTLKDVVSGPVEYYRLGARFSYESLLLAGCVRLHSSAGTMLVMQNAYGTRGSRVARFAVGVSLVLGKKWRIQWDVAPVLFDYGVMGSEWDVNIRYVLVDHLHMTLAWNQLFLGGASYPKNLELRSAQLGLGLEL